MSKIIIADYKTDEVLDHIIQNDVIDNAHEQDMSTWVETFEFETFANKEYAKHLTDRNLLLIPAEEGGFRELFIVNATRFSTSTGAKMIDITAYGFYQKLTTAKIIDPGRTPSQAAEPHMRDILAGTNVNIGNVAYTGNRTITRENSTDPFAALKSLANEFDKELNFRVEIENGKVVRYADLLDRIGADRGRTIEFGRDLQTISRKSDSSNIVTALLVLGPRDEEGNRLEVFVEDEDARKRWSEDGSHIVKTYEPQTENQDITRERLETLGRTELNKRINAIVSWEINITDLEHVPGMSGMKIRYGDTIFVKDTGFNPPFYVEARIFKQRRNIFNPGSKQVTLGDFREFTIQEVRSEWEKLREELERKIGWLDLRVDATVIEGSLRIIEKDKLTVDSRYAEISVHPNLPVEIFNSLADAKATYDMSYSTLHSYLTDENEDFEYLYEVYSGDLAHINSVLDLALDEISIDRDDRIQQELERAEQEIEDAKDRLDESEGRLDDTRDRLDETEGRLDDSQARIEEAEGRLDSARDELDQLESDLEDTNNRLLDKVNVIDYEERIGEIRDDIASKVDGEWVDDRLRVGLDNLEIGGRNLLLKENMRNWADASSQIGQSGNWRGWFAKVEPSQTYSLSRSYLTVRFRYYLLTEAPYVGMPLAGLTNNHDNDLKIEGFQTESDTQYIFIYYSNTGEDDPLIQLEKGNKATDWSPAPEDIFADLENKPNYDDIYIRSDLDNMFDNTVSLTAYEADQQGYVERFIDYETNISQTWEAINARVESTDYDYDQGILDNRLTEWEATADGISQTVSNLRVDFDGLEIGGRNLILDSHNLIIDRGDGYRGILSFSNDENLIRVEAIGDKSSTANFYNTGFANLWNDKDGIFESISNSDEYTLSMEVRYKGSSRIRMGFDTRGVSSSEHARTEYVTDTGKKWVKIYAVKKETNRPPQTQSLITGWFDRVSIGDYIEIRNIKLEKGNKATDWSPAPEDVTNYTETRIEQLSDEISLTYVKDDELIAGIRIGEERINGANIEITGDTLIRGDIGADGATFIDLTTREMTAIDATIENAIITGTLDSSTALFQFGEFREARILEALITDATITGTLDSEDAIFQRGTFRNIYAVDADIENATITGEFIAGNIEGVDISGSTITSRPPGIALSETVIQGGNITSRNLATGAEMTVRNGNISGGSITSNTTIDVSTDLRVGNLIEMGSRESEVFFRREWAGPGAPDYIMQIGTPVRAEVVNIVGSYRPIMASSFPTGSSEQFKSDIENFEESALDILRDTTIYSYYKDGVPNRELGMIIERDMPEIIKHDDISVNGYSHRSLNTKAIQELDDDLNKTREELVLKIANLERRINELEVSA